MPRKTIQVADLLFKANTHLADANTTPDGRDAMCCFIESVLFATGNYEGYRYLGTFDTKGCGTRRFYFVSSAIQDHYSAIEAAYN